MLSILAAHAATTGGVAPAQTTSFQLFKLPGHILQKPSSFGFLHVFWYKWGHSHYPQSRPRVFSRLALSVLSTTQWDSRKVTWWRWMWTSWNNYAENAKTQRVCIAWSYSQRKEQKQSKCQLRTGLSVPLKCSSLHESAARPPVQHQWIVRSWKNSMWIYDLLM